MLGGLISLASFGNSTNGAQFFDGTTNLMVATTGTLVTDRESAIPVALPNHKILIVGGQHCAVATFGNSGFECTALQTAELYNESTKTFTLAGSGSGGLMAIARTGPTATLISGSGTALDGKVLIVGGATGSSFLTTATTPSPGAPPGQTALNSAEIYDPLADSFTATNSIPGCAAGTICATGLPSVCPGGITTAITAASESSTTVTITSASNPPGLIIGDNVTIAGVTPVGYNGTFIVTGIPTGATFTYTTTAGLAAGTAFGTSAADTVECGLEDHAAALIPNFGGKVLVAGGDNFTFLAAATTQAFLFDPATALFTATGSMTAKRELFQMTALDPGAVGGPLGGQILATGGVDGESIVCSPVGNVVATTQGSAELYNPNTGLWTAVAGAPSPITSAAEAGTTVTITSAANPAGLIIGGGVTVAGVNKAGYNGTFAVTGIPTGATFTYTTTAGIVAGTGGTAQANTMTAKRAGHGTVLWTSGTLSGKAMPFGGIDIEAGTLPSTCVVVTSLKQTTTRSVDIFDPGTGAEGTFTATGAMNQSRGGMGAGFVGVGSNSGDFIVMGGECAQGHLTSFVVGTANSVTCSVNAPNDFSELFDPGTGIWTVGPVTAGTVIPTNGPASGDLK